MLLAIDIGTTNLKAGVFREDGGALSLVSRPNPKTREASGIVVYEPERLWETAANLIREAAEAAGGAAVRAIGITSMAESGLLLDRGTGRARTPVLPWFETFASAQAERIGQETDARELFAQSGLAPSFKQGLAKLLWLQERQPDALAGAVWLSVSAYLAYRLTGRIAEDPTLAARTLAYRIDRREWNVPLLRHFGLDPKLLPPVLPAGEPVGMLEAALAGRLGLPIGTTVALAGHDHVCASLAVLGEEQDGAYNSMGTAETLVGTFPERKLGESDAASGLSFGLHPVPGRMFWMGGHSSSGGAVEWLRGLIADDGAGYDALMALLERTSPGPTGIVFFPYLSGSGAPYPDPTATASFAGLTSRHGKGDLLKAVLEGNAYQLELMRRAAERVGGRPAAGMRVVGGGTRNAAWMQIKADVSGIPLAVPGAAEATLLGAALTAGVAVGVFGSFQAAARALKASDSVSYEPDNDRHLAYRRLFEEDFLARLPAAKRIDTLG
ncbi:FGGY-family carbohydrate kinase [Cohnella zeiphila]|uniref:Carbohydrate kinase n=1 Tax=Cohnella zeiphila TaxID=2761120 RepID=A0A7X0STH0_9BACL|nr:FGGY family carbohydrate kinase [Cohnella zeiphila]MBB6735793.1 carbohydrate kinase [Cohnella zeiphila]